MVDFLPSNLKQKVSYLTNDNVSIVGDAWGSPENPTVLLAHGGGQTRHAWGKTAQVLSQEGLYAIALDLRGHGDSSWHPKGDYRLDIFVDDICSIAATFAHPPVLVGASLGAFSGLLAEGESPHSVFSAIVFVDIALRFEEEGVDRIFSFMNAHAQDGFADLDEAAKSIAEYYPNRSKQNDLESLKKNLRLKPDGRYYWHWDPNFMAMPEIVKRSQNFERFSAAARSLRIPTLLVRGHSSDVVSIEAAKEFLELVPHAEFVEVQKAGHMVVGDQNDQFSDSVINFIKWFTYNLNRY